VAQQRVHQKSTAPTCRSGSTPYCAGQSHCPDAGRKDRLRCYAVAFRSVKRETLPSMTIVRGLIRTETVVSRLTGASSRHAPRGCHLTGLPPGKLLNVSPRRMKPSNRALGVDLADIKSHKMDHGARATDISALAERCFSVEMSNGMLDRFSQ
jgi:hypothetical protein